MQNKTVEDKFKVVEWTIENFSCWSEKIHDNVIISPKSQTKPEFALQLYPKGLNGHDKHMKLNLWYSYSVTFHGNVDISFIGSDGSLLCTKQMDLKPGSIYIEFSPGPKFKEVFAQIRQNEVLHGDRLIVRYRLKEEKNSMEYMRTTIDVYDVSLKILPEILDCVDSSVHRISTIKVSLQDKEIGPIILRVSRDQTDHSKIALILHFFSFKQNASIFTRVSVLSNDSCNNCVKAEENEHLFRDCSPWTFSNSLTTEELASGKFTFILYMRITFNTSYKHSVDLYNNRPSAVDILPTGSNINRSLVCTAESTPTSPQPDSSVTVLTNELMCLYQDQEFSDLKLKCGSVSFPVHKNILSARSPVFKTMLSSNMKEATSGEVDITDLDAPSLSLFLTYLYTGTVEDLQGESALKLYYAADKYQVPSLQRECVSVLCSNVSMSNVCDVLSLADQHQDEQLLAVAHQFFLRNYNEVVRSAEWKSFMRSDPVLAVETLTNFAEKNSVRNVEAL